ncbi:hypothetical protein IWX90DRAFT_412241 [Phyllosticta citrichinensis]|uniref:Uncharacterized protein n=1 Tax=Phyllosticta citrichinensis TaxID=1130410 RepID=A0ABR1Y3H1_9PEZI
MDHGRAPDRKRGFDETQKDDNDLASKESEKLVKNWRKTLHGASEDDRRSHGEHSSPPNHLQLILTKDAIFARALCTVEPLKAKRDILVKLDGRITAIRNNLNVALDRFTQALIKTFRGAPGMTAEDFGFKEYQLVNHPSDRKRYSAQELIDRSTRYALGSKIEMYSSLRYAVGMSACIVHVTLSEVPEHITFADLDTSEAYNYNKVFHLGRFSVTMRDAFRKLTQFMTAITDKIKWIDLRMNQCTGNLAQTGLKDKNEMLK